MRTESATNVRSRSFGFCSLAGAFKAVIYIIAFSFSGTGASLGQFAPIFQAQFVHLDKVDIARRNSFAESDTSRQFVAVNMLDGRGLDFRIPRSARRLRISRVRSFGDVLASTDHGIKNDPSKTVIELHSFSKSEAVCEGTGA